MMDSFKDLQIEIQRLIEKTFLASRAIDQESLCVSNGKLVWQITVEITADYWFAIDPTHCNLAVAVPNKLIASAIVQYQGSTKCNCAIPV